MVNTFRKNNKQMDIRITHQMEITKRQMEEYATHLLENERLDDFEANLDKIPFEVVERYVRKKKLKKINNKRK